MQEDQAVFRLHIDDLASLGSTFSVKLPLDAKVDDLIAIVADDESVMFEGCAGFLAVERRIDDEDEDQPLFEEDFDVPPKSFGGADLAEKLTANGGTLLLPGNALSSYGLSSTTCNGITLFAVSDDVDRQPTVFQEDLKRLGFGEVVFKYVKLHPDSKQLVAARQYFSGPPLSWFQSKSQKEGAADRAQTITFGMDENFEEASTLILALQITHENEKLNVSCKNMAGDTVCSINFASNDVVATLQSSLCARLQWASMTIWHGSEPVSDPADPVSKYSLLTVAPAAPGHVHGVYWHISGGHRPAGYSSSGSNLANVLALEPGKAALLYHFKGDYKRAAEVRRLAMLDAQWNTQTCEGQAVVRITGKAVLDRYYVHERCGYDGTSLEEFECYASVTIPIEQLEQAQTQDYHHSTTEGSGWTCGSENYKCSFFLPMCVVGALRVAPESVADNFLRRQLNLTGSPQYPYNVMATRMGRWNQVERTIFERVPEKALDVIKHLRERIGDNADAEIDANQIARLQETFLQSPTADTQEV